MTLTYDNGEGLEFRRTIAVDDKYLFTIKDEVANKGANPVTLYPYALISRHGTPQTLGYYILHEGLIGVLGDQGLQEFTYNNIEEKKVVNFDVTNGWLGITDKYWAATLLPDTDSAPEGALLDRHARHHQDLPGRLSARRADDRAGRHRRRQCAAVRRRQGSRRSIDDYDKQLKLNRFDLLIDWGWFYFITKPLFIVDRLPLSAWSAISASPS